MGTVEGRWKPIHDEAQLFKGLSGVASFGAELYEVAGGVQFEHPRSLNA